tara:strand:- start:1020 stop:1496 length:477 start_codon:yes stop_codon:yes gene_type:complete
MNTKKNKWSDADLRYLNSKMKTTKVKNIAETLKRSEPAIRQQISRINRGLTVVPKLNHTKFTKERTAKVIEPVSKGHSIIIIRSGDSRKNKKWCNREIIFISQTLHKKPKWVARKLKRTVGSVNAARNSYIKGGLSPSIHRKAVVVLPWWKQIFKKNK